jgi:hypothetical protein
MQVRIRGLGILLAAVGQCLEKATSLRPYVFYWIPKVSAIFLTINLRSGCLLLCCGCFYAPMPITHSSFGRRD